MRSAAGEPAATSLRFRLSHSTTPEAVCSKNPTPPRLKAACPNLPAIWPVWMAYAYWRRRARQADEGSSTRIVPLWASTHTLTQAGSTSKAPERCQANSQGASSAWGVANSRRSSPGKSSVIRLAISSADGDLPSGKETAIGLGSWALSQRPGRLKTRPELKLSRRGGKIAMPARRCSLRVRGKLVLRRQSGTPLKAAQFPLKWFVKGKTNVFKAKQAPENFLCKTKNCDYRPG